LTSGMIDEGFCPAELERVDDDGGRGRIRVGYDNPVGLQADRLPGVPLRAHFLSRG